MHTGKAIVSAATLMTGVAGVAAHEGAANAERKNLIIDTDMYSDVDDAGAILLAATAPNVNLLAVNVNEYSSYSVLAASALTGWYYRPDEQQKQHLLNTTGGSEVPIGARRPMTNNTFSDTWSHNLGEFASKVAHKFSGGAVTWGHAEEQAWDAVRLYRKTLAAAEDASVTIVSIGYLDNLSDLLSSTADDISPLSGAQLLMSKVAELVVMGGDYPSGREYNLYHNPKASAHVINSWRRLASLCNNTTPDLPSQYTPYQLPPPLVFIGFSLGMRVVTGGPLMTHGPGDDPARAAYHWYTYGKPRQSWDPLSVLYATRGLGGMFRFANAGGHNLVDAGNGSNRWIQDADDGQQAAESATTQRGHQYWLDLAVDKATAEAEVDELLLQGARMRSRADDGKPSEDL